MSDRNPFRGIKGAQVTGGGAYILPGKHLLEVQACKLIESTKQNTDMFVAEFEVVESTNDEMVPGTHRSWVVNFAHKPALGNIKGFLAAAFQCPDSEIDEEVCFGAVAVPEKGEDHMMAGIKVRCEANTIQTKSGNPFTKCTYFPVTEG